MPDGHSQELIYSRALPGNETYLIALSGPTGSGKTLSALRLARGLAGPNGKIYAADTENRRMLRYARMFEFEYCSIAAPFLSEKYTTAAEIAQKAHADVLILDSVSHEHVGPGGMLERFEDELARLAGDNWDRREKLKGTAWIKPKRAHKAMLQRLIQLNMHVICCLRAEPKLIIRDDPKKPGKTEWLDAGLQPVCGSDFMFDMTMSFMLYPVDPKQPGYDPRGFPVPIKLDEQDAHLIPLDRPLDEAVGAAIAAKARGEDPAPGETTPPSTPQLRGASKNRAKADELIARFGATRTLEDHAAIIADDTVQASLRWFAAKRPDFSKEIHAALHASWQRCNPPPAKIDKDRQRADDILAAVKAADSKDRLRAVFAGAAMAAVADRWKRERPDLAGEINAAEQAKLAELQTKKELT
jgi:hypothetical protein